MKVLWPHTFPPEQVSGIFMKRQLKSMVDIGVDIDLEYLGNISNPFIFHKSLQKIRQMAPKYDLVHSPYGSGCGYLVSKVNAPKVITLRGTDLNGGCSLLLKEKFKDCISRKMTNISLKKYHFIIVMSERMKKKLPDEVRQKSEVITDGIDLDEFFPIPRQDARKKLGKENEIQKWISFYPGLTLNVSNKRPYLARAAFDLVKKHVPDAELIEIAGVPPDKMNLMINASDVVLLTSVQEGWPNIIKEAMACNVPFVATDVSDLMNLAASSPSCYVSEVDTPEDLAEGILKALETLDKFGRQKLRKNIEFLKITRVAAQLNQIYETVANQC